ncbi:DUF5994 family protein [Catellatospora tritici]|uniref:DUF5994 family protein n=1 Tax=Catellatospora tritici TaxID=2851566 RepID=UPI001C2D964D|nr:DUF5994 family protein [Catellatospora tritici]MBV1856354.1 hypothetical protein [Catellatospora tritici]
MIARVGPPDLMGLIPASAQRDERLRIEPTHTTAGMLDGGWWPHSTDPAEALPGLVLAIDPIRGPVVRFVLGAGGWNPHPEHIHVGGRRIEVAYSASQPASLLTARCAGGRRVDLLVVAPCTPRDVAARSLLRAAQTGNRVAAPLSYARAADTREARSARDHDGAGAP